MVDLLIYRRDFQFLSHDALLLLAYYRSETECIHQSLEMREEFREFTRWEMQQLDEARRNGRYSIPVKQIQEDIKMSPDRQRKALKELIKKGYADTQTEGMPPVRWISLLNPKAVKVAEEGGDE